MGAGHNISPRLRKQLVLELEGRVEGAELVDEGLCRAVQQPQPDLITRGMVWAHRDRGGAGQ